MTINATLIIQIIHFIIAYYLLKALFFKPVLKLIEQEEHDLAAAHQKLSAEQANYQAAVEHKKEAWAHFKTEFTHQAPERITPQPNESDALTISAPAAIKPQDLEKEIKALARTITQKAGHVD